jgi:hypothetical protein
MLNHATNHTPTVVSNLNQPELKFEIPFNSDIYLNQTELIIRYIYKSYLKDARESLFVGLISILIGISIIIGKSFLGIVFVLLGIFYTLKSYPKFQIYNKLVSTSLKKESESFAKVESDFSNGIFEFRADSLKFYDNNISRDIKWIDFKGFKLIKSNLLLILEPDKGDIMIIGESEVGIDNFKKIVEFVKHKLK